MKEVSCQAFPIFFKDLKKKNLSPEILCDGISYDLAYLSNVKENVEWDVYCRIMLNSRRHYTEDDYVELGIKVVKWRVLPVLSAMVGIFLNPMQVYRLITDTRKGIGTQQFRCITTTSREIDKYHLEILLELPPGYQYCTEFFLITKGFFIACPALLKLNYSNVIMVPTERGALYKISLPDQPGVLTKFRQFLSFPSSRTAFVRELNESYELLYDRFNQLEESKVKIQKQAKQLETAYSISQIIRSDLDLDSTLHAVAKSLIEVAEFAAVEININSTLDHEPLRRMVCLGNIPENSKPLKRLLEGHGKSIGEINLWLHPKSSVDDARHLLDYIIPTITIEILNTISFKLAGEYREKLERKFDEIQKAIIDERKRIAGELHDDLGTNLSIIALMTGVMKENISRADAEKISATAQQSIEKISDIVWSLNPKNDKLENLVAYIRKYAIEYFEMTSIQCKVNVLNKIPDTTMNGEQRRNIFLSVKEALHNVLKHSCASSVQLNFLNRTDGGEIVIHDNGHGIAEDKFNEFGNGIQNMKQRMQAVGGYFSVETEQGTIIRLGYRLT